MSPSRAQAALPPVALTMGDPAGIGGEIAMAAWQSGRVRHPYFAVDDPARLAPLGPVVRIEAAAEATEAFARGLPVLPIGQPVRVTPGRPEPALAPLVVESIARAVALAQAGDAAAVVTNPIAKKVLYDGAGFAFPGHTEYLGALAGGRRTVMMLAGPSLRVVPATVHIPLAEVPAALSVELIVETAEIALAGLVGDFGISAPQMAVAGLNPHAGEGGAIGREEIEIVAPAVEILRGRGHRVRGPLPADTMFHAAARSRYDAALCMYHDQALVPLKALDFDDGVNVTLGLPFVRTSPDHGTAFDIAGQGIARADSLIAALTLAGGLAAHRATAAAGRPEV
ncbi:MAG: 4-hydroxythreonine-4-phosphate dehydrogenase PdxA [Paracoccaceae bacterium]